MQKLQPRRVGRARLQRVATSLARLDAQPDAAWLSALCFELRFVVGSMSSEGLAQLRQAMLVLCRGAGQDLIQEAAALTAALSTSSSS